MSQPRPFHNDTTLTKLFVGGLAWETQRDTMRRYFEQFGDILEAVVITDKNTARSKGYGFVTFRDPEAAMRACQNPSPVIDGRRANCNLASLGAHKPRPPGGRFRGLAGTQYTFPYSAYGYGGYSQDNMYPMNYYGVYGGQQFPPYYTGMFPNFYPVYAQSSQVQGFGVHYPYVPQQQYFSAPTTAMSSASIARVSVTEGVPGTRAAPQSSAAAGSQQNSST